MSVPHSTAIISFPTHCNHHSFPRHNKVNKLPQTSFHHKTPHRFATSGWHHSSYRKLWHTQRIPWAACTDSDNTDFRLWTCFQFAWYWRHFLIERWWNLALRNHHRKHLRCRKCFRIRPRLIPNRIGHHRRRWPFHILDSGYQCIVPPMSDRSLRHQMECVKSMELLKIGNHFLEP